MTSCAGSVEQSTAPAIGCPSAGAAGVVQCGTLKNRAIIEASGLARSNVFPGRLWTINDGGSGPLLYAIGDDGSDHGTVAIDGARNRDWEDLASFVVDGRAMLLIADIGDNEARRRFLTLYIVEEPVPGPDTANRAAIAWKIHATIPNGPADAESVSVDAGSETVLILSKRDIPAVLYALPLRPPDDRPIVAKRLGTVASLPQPSQRDRDDALATKNWHWQPTAMDISPGGEKAVILTYRGLYLYDRLKRQPWADALQREPRSISLGDIREAEAAAFSADGSAIFVTAEKRHAPLLRFDLD